ncbi:MAG: hypothetical protein KDA88_21425 [Planctomycetaceae bacterium]|nr:hypothetical protein [Planctomycetaceae bacterium]MCB9949380.1 hypothetical protein [Planctomycetaceae bacterium]
MNLSELQQKLHEAGIPAHAYCLTGGLPNESYCIERRGDGVWTTYYSERGMRTGIKTFTNELTACQDVFDVVTHWFDRKQKS